MPEESRRFPPSPCEPDGREETVRVLAQDEGEGCRSYVLTTTAPQRGGGPQARTIREASGDLRTRTCSLLFDALFTQAIDDARLNSVETIRDGAYNGGRPIPCRCFQTGEIWTYVWTRDIAYAIDLGLALTDPARAAHSLAFKTSGFRQGLAPPAGLPEGALQIVQDTGSGGSWPVSSDRVAWAIGAESVLAALDGTARDDFAETALRALGGTLEADREAVFDAGDGLYRGELSFLDWREQTYAPWVVDDLTTIASSKALSTNVCHYRALRLAARLAGARGEGAVADRYADWAEALKRAINAMFWLPEKGLYASLTTPDAPALPLGKFDMLGTALAIVSGIADRERARAALSAYPQAPFGPPVYYPQQPDIRVYHNRALWPFVTAYALEAAARAGHVAAADHAFFSLMRAAALHLDNVENQEWLTGRTEFDDGPAISSRRQLWSVGGYIGMVAKIVFGLRLQDDGIRIAPFLTARMRAALGGEAAVLDNIVYRGHRLAITLHLPPASGDHGFHPVRALTLNGTPFEGAIPAGRLGEDNRIEVRFGDLIADDAGLTRVPDVSPLSHDGPDAFAPREPTITDLVVESGRVRLNFAGQPPRSGRRDDLLFTVLRDGAVAANTIDGSVWFDPEPLRPGVRRRYRVIAAFRESGNASHPSLAAVVDAGAVATIGIDGSDVERDGRRIVFRNLAVREDGRYHLDLTYANRLFHIQTGVTNAVKRMRVFNAAGAAVACAIVQMPHMTPVNGPRASTGLETELKVGTYSVEITDYFNMSYLTANATYISPGGASGPINDADIRSLNLIRIP